MRKIAIYGKGGIGKSTTASNLSAALSDMGYRVLQIGCDPKADSTKNLTGGRKITTVLDAIREKGEENVEVEDILYRGYTTIRHIGKTGNRYGSVFVMPSLFARICREIPQAFVHVSESGALAEPVLLFWRRGISRAKKSFLQCFFDTEECAAPFRAVSFPVPGHPGPEDIPIDRWCREHLLYPQRSKLKI